MIVQCPTCILKYNNETVSVCRACHPKKKNNSPSNKKRRKEHWQLVKLHGQKTKILKEQQIIGGEKQSYDYFSSGKRKHFGQRRELKQIEQD